MSSGTGSSLLLALDCLSLPSFIHPTLPSVKLFEACSDLFVKGKYLEWIFFFFFTGARYLKNKEQRYTLTFRALL